MRLALLAAALVGPAAFGAPPLTVERQVTLAQLFNPDEIASLSRTLPGDRVLRFRVRQPGADSHGVVVYVSPTDSGELPADWAEALDRRVLLYVGADGFGNSRPTAERMLAAVAALKMVYHATDGRRLYVAGMSGGGRVASQVITHFPQLFTGALCIAGADYFMPQDEALRSRVASRRIVLLTGNRDFNQHEMRMVSRRYQQAGVARVLLLDLPEFAHQLPDAGVLSRALDFLDAS